MKVRDLVKLIEREDGAWPRCGAATGSTSILRNRGESPCPDTVGMMYVPDLPGCITTGQTVEEVERNIREAIELHLDGLREDGLPIPEPATAVAYVEPEMA